MRVTEGVPKNRRLQMKLRLLRMAVALSSLAALVASVGADQKWG